MTSPILTVTCAYCGSTLHRKAWQIRGATHLFCGQDCYRAWSRQLGNVQGRPRTRILRTCRTCGKEFYRWPSQLKQRPGEFCSDTCKAPRIRELKLGTRQSPEARAKVSAARRGQPAPHRAKPPTRFTCLFCGTDNELPGKLTSVAAKRKFCGAACRLAYQRGQTHQPHVSATTGIASVHGD
jgi:hypothetical protein